MNKALKVFSLATVSAFLLAGCAKTTDVNASLNTGTMNYDFTGKTFVNTDTISYTKRVTIDVYDSSTGKTVSTVTDSLIPYRTVTTTLVFAADNTLTESQVYTNLAGIDGDYRTTVSTSTVGTVTTTTTTEYLNGSMVIDLYTVGRAGTTTWSDSYSGTWKPYSLQDSATDGETQNYLVSYSSENTANTYFDSSDQTVTAVTGSTNTTKTTYTVDSTETNKIDVDPNETIDVSYALQGTTTVAGVEKDVITIQFQLLGDAKKMKFDPYEFSMDFIIQ